jgi:hypothetical protein
MAKLVILYDKRGRINFNPEDLINYECKQAILSLADDLENKDIYDIARKLAEMLLEQL